MRGERGTTGRSFACDSALLSGAERGKGPTPAHVSRQAARSREPREHVTSTRSVSAGKSRRRRSGRTLPAPRRGRTARCPTRPAPRAAPARRAFADKRAEKRDDAGRQPVVQRREQHRPEEVEPDEQKRERVHTKCLRCQTSKFGIAVGEQRHSGTGRVGQGSGRVGQGSGTVPNLGDRLVWDRGRVPSQTWVMRLVRNRVR